MFDVHAVRRKLEVFANDSVKRYIPRIWLNFLNLLAVKSKADKLRFEPISFVPQERKAAIKVCAAHANTMSVLVECDDRCDNEIDILRSNLHARLWLPQTVPVPSESCIGV